VSVAWLAQRASDVPVGDDWLDSSERSVLAGLSVEKRRREWRLGRWTAKQAVRNVHHGPFPSLARIRITAADDGAPEAFVDGEPLGLAISITHRAAWSVCAVATPSVKVGCDLEVVEPRSDRFVTDYFTPDERATIAALAPEERVLRVATLWSAKESTLKAVRTGLRRDTRSVEVAVFDDPAGESPWGRFTVVDVPSADRFGGWWRAWHRLVLTVATRPVIPHAPNELELRP
jgi:4'-phosphopantetheinyl transferase